MHATVGYLDVTPGTETRARFAPPPPPPAIEPAARYGAARRPRWEVIAAIALAHALLLTALVRLDVIHVSRHAPKPLVVTLAVEPPPPPPADPEPVKLQPKPDVPQPEVINVPEAVVQTPAPPPPVQVTTAPPPPPQAVVVAPPAPKAAPSGPVSVTDLDTKMISAPPPTYPIESRRKREEGTVQLSVLLGLDGRVSDLSIAHSSGFDRLDKAALAAVKRWRWQPTLRDGVAVMVKGIVEIPFGLKG